MKDTEINCRCKDCYWNIGLEFDDNCACRVVKVAHTCICRSYITRAEAERRFELEDAKTTQQ